MSILMPTTNQVHFMFKMVKHYKVTWSSKIATGCMCYKISVFKSFFFLQPQQADHISFRYVFNMERNLTSRLISSFVFIVSKYMLMCFPLPASRFCIVNEYLIYTNSVTKSCSQCFIPNKYVQWFAFFFTYEFELLIVRYLN